MSSPDSLNEYRSQLDPDMLDSLQTHFVEDGVVHPIALAFLRRIDPQGIWGVRGPGRDLSCALRAKSIITFGRMRPEITVGMWNERPDVTNFPGRITYLEVQGMGKTGQHDLSLYTGNPQYDHLRLKVESLDANPDYSRWLVSLASEVVASLVK